MPRISHHDLRVRLAPAAGQLSATDRLSIAGDDGPLFLHLNPRLTLDWATQGAESLTLTAEHEDALARRYRVDGWRRDGLPVTVSWSGCLDRFEGYRVCAIGPGCVELSGFANWFPTIEPQSQLEQFTYDLGLELPDGWGVVTPGITAHGDTNRSEFSWTRPIEDILICAAPAWQEKRVACGPVTLRLYAAGFSARDLDGLGEDFASAVRVAERHFGQMEAGCGGAFVITPRGPKAADWGYERGDIWVVGDEFARALLTNDWRLPHLPGPLSLSLHETIHAWFGQALRFEDPWLAEAITQYLQVVLTEEMFGRPGLAGDYFEWYRSRVTDQLAKADRAISSLSINDNTYVYWYLKGSWAFWDLEASFGRDVLITALAGTYGRHVRTTVTTKVFQETLSGLLGQPLADHFDHWFGSAGFAPRYRR